MPPRASTSGQQDKQKSISHFFSGSGNASGKRARSPVDLTLDSDEEPPAKRAKGTNTSKYTASKAKTSQSSESPIKKKYKYLGSEDSPSPKAKPADPETRKKQEKRRKELKETLQQTFKHTDARSSSPQSWADNLTQVNTDDEDDSDGTTANLRSRFASNLAVDKRTTSGKSKKKNEVLGPSGQAYTPLELQVKQLKEENPGTLLLFEVGYKYRFFGDDAIVASKALGIACFLDRNFLTGSIPVHRKMIHTKKLLSLGHRVGIVGQTETAALKKAGNNKSGPFERKITELYTATTFVDEMESTDDGDSLSNAGAALLCLSESLMGGMGADERVSIGLVSVSPATGEVVYDEFVDGAMRTELETRIAHIKPCELLLPAKGLSPHTDKMLRHYVENGHGRIEAVEEILPYSEAFEYLREFYDTETAVTQTISSTFEQRQPIVDIVDFPKQVVVALAHAVRHLNAYGLSDAFRKTAFFAKFLERSHMLLNANTLTNLEIFENQTDFTKKGSLISILDRTQTQFGSRYLRQWIGKPLVNEAILRERFDAVEEIHQGQSANLIKLQGLFLKRLPDLVRGLCRIQYGKSNPKEVSSVLSALSKVATAFPSFERPEDVGFKSALLNDIVFSLPRIHDPVQAFLGDLDLKQAKEGNLTELWKNPDKYPEVEDARFAIVSVEMHLKEHLKEVRKVLRRPTLEFVSVSGVDYLIEVPNVERTKVPTDWVRIQGTKKVTRFHSPEARRHVFERDQHMETLNAVAAEAFLKFQAEINAHYSVLRDAVNKLAMADALMSIARVGTMPGYVKPEIVEEGHLEIVQGEPLVDRGSNPYSYTALKGRHPTVETVSSSPFVPNDIKLNGERGLALVITGPNMGGKSSCVKLTALIVIMAQIGCYVPADAANIPLHDAILTRMGAFDEISRGRSTFMVEMSETAEILRSATKRSLVILDELGRGTATYDGLAIATSVLEYVVTQIKCRTLFITHYPQIGVELSRRYPTMVRNAHMGYVEEQLADGRREIHFLYTLKDGIAQKSFGVECGQLAGLPRAVLDVAAAKSKELEEREYNRKLRSTLLRVNALVKVARKTEDDQKELVEVTARIKNLVKH